MSYLSELNSEQLDAIQAPSPTVVNASAGSGKTRCLIAKILRILDQGAHPENILAITFTNKAAREMKQRLKTQVSSIDGMQISTIHSMCVRIIHQFIQHTPLKKPFSIYDDADQLSIVKTVAKARNIKEDPSEILSTISKAKGDQKEHLLDGAAEIVYKAYSEILIQNNACDFDDLLIYADKCLKQEDCRAFYSGLWRHILVDEFQDTSAIQYSIVMSIFNPEKTSTMFLVGDANQSIYSWRGACPDNMKTFIEKYKPSVKYLTYNYRSCTQVIAHANKFLQFGKAMVPKSSSIGKVSFTGFRSQEEEAAKIADGLLQMGGFEETAILFRVNTRTLLFEKAFAQRRIPYKVVGALPFYRRKVAKDLLSYCKAAVNRSDIESLNRIVNVPKRGFGETKQERLLREGWSYLESMAGEMPLIGGLIKLLDKIKAMTPERAVNEILHQTNYSQLLTKDNDHLMLQSFQNVISEFKTIDELVLASTFLEEDSGRGVKLMTAHASKGLEFDRVFVVGLEHDLWPHKMSLNKEEEERLFYVAATRAKSYLNLSYAKSKLYKGHPITVEPSYLFIKSYSESKK
jgi:DNA helicase-2/ATP-dependent DNA helicase PcrA